jgi:dienelactone hydrolase
VGPADVNETPDSVELQEVADALQPAKPWQLTVTCDDSAESVYAASIADVDASTPRGTVVACHKDALLAADEIAADAANDGVQTSAAIQPYRISYVTERNPGTPGLGTARVMVPEPHPEAPVHVVVVTHGTTGLNDKCAPSNNPKGLVEMALPFAGNDMVVVAPDYAGLGNEGTQGYGDSHDTAHSALDAQRAAHALFSPGTLTDSYAVIGHSQGGGAALYSQGLASAYGSEQTLKAVVAFAPGWTSSDEANRLPYAYPQLISVTLGAGVSTAAFVLALYADVANQIDPTNPGMFFHADRREELVEWIETRCVFGLAAKLLKLGSEVKLSHILDPDFVAGSLSCIDKKPSCAEPYAGFIERQRAGFIPPDAQGAPILFVQGKADIQATPERAACYLEAMAALGVTPQTCVDVDPEATHFKVVSRNLALASDWIRAHLNGTELPTCEYDATELGPCE